MNKLSTPRRKKARQIPILVVEDNADHWLIIRSALAQCFPEVAPVWMNNASQTVTYLETATEVPRLILLDMYLPRREDGLGLLEFIKNYKFERKPPVVMLSSSQDNEDVEAAYSLHVASYIVKPLTYHEWLNCFYAFRRYWWEIVTLPVN